jgi:hypothetical protein
MEWLRRRCARARTHLDTPSATRRQNTSATFGLIVFTI